LRFAFSEHDGTPGGWVALFLPDFLAVEEVPDATTFSADS